MLLLRKNERRSMRKIVRLPCQVVREHDFRLVGEESVDLSPDGMLVFSRLPVEPGQSLLVSFQATPYGLWFDTEAEVTRIVLGRRTRDLGAQVGLRFTGLDSVKKLILRGHLRKMPPPLPSRAPRVDYAATIRSIAA